MFRRDQLALNELRRVLGPFLCVREAIMSCANDAGTMSEKWSSFGIPHSSAMNLKNLSNSNAVALEE